MTIEVLLMERAREQLRALKFDAPMGGSARPTTGPDLGEKTHRFPKGKNLS